MGGLHSQTKELLNILLWSAENLANPTFRNLTESYESWAYRNGFDRCVSALEKQRSIERHPDAENKAIYRLTPKGRLQALAGRDPRLQWNRKWDGKWRLAIFDVPVSQNSRRKSLRRVLHRLNFGCLQDSVWVSPDRLNALSESLSGEKASVKSFILLDARPADDATNDEIVAAAWNFAEINRRYEHVLQVLNERPQAPLGSEASANALQVWARAERAAWEAAVTIDPLLPAKLLPKIYLGQKAWNRRVAVLKNAGKQLQTFQS